MKFLCLDCPEYNWATTIVESALSSGILLPQAVWREVVETGGERPGARKFASASWITVCKVANTPLVSLLHLELDEGEAEAIALGCEQSVHPIILDEKNARRLAQRLGLAALGTVGILIWAKRADLIPNLRTQLDTLQN